MAFDAFLKIEGIPGESTDDKHKDWIDVLSFSWGMSQPARATGRGGAGAERVQVADISFNHLLDKASPKLFSACASGSHIKDATLELRSTGGREAGSFYMLKLTDVMVSSVKQAGIAQGTTPTEVSAQAALLPQVKPPEDVALNFLKIEWTYKQQNPDGTLSNPITGFLDLRMNRAG